MPKLPGVNHLGAIRTLERVSGVEGTWLAALSLSREPIVRTY